MRSSASEETPYSRPRLDPFLVVSDKEIEAQLGTDGSDAADDSIGPKIRQAEEGSMVGVVDESESAIERDVVGLEGGFDKRGEMTRTVEDDCHVIGGFATPVARRRGEGAKAGFRHGG